MYFLSLGVKVLIIIICLPWCLSNISGVEIQRDSSTDQSRVYMELQPKEVYRSLNRTTSHPPGAELQMEDLM